MGNEGFLRPLRREDATAVLDAFAATDMDRQGDVRTAAQAQDYVTRLIAPDGRHRAVAVCDAETMVGLVAVRVDVANRLGWVSYWMGGSHRGRGWTSRAVATVATHQLGEGGLERLELAHRANNPASGGVARAAGFVREGRERAKFLIDGERIDVLTYGRLCTDPAPATLPMPWHT